MAPARGAAPGRVPGADGAGSRGFACPATRRTSRRCLRRCAAAPAPVPPPAVSAAPELPALPVPVAELWPLGCPDLLLLGQAIAPEASRAASAAFIHQLRIIIMTPSP